MSTRQVMHEPKVNLVPCRLSFLILRVDLRLSHLFFLSLKHSFHWLAPLSTLASHYESSWLKERKGRQAPGLCARGLEKTAIHSESLINLEAVDSMCLLLAPSTATIAFLTRLSAEREEK